MRYKSPQQQILSRDFLAQNEFTLFEPGTLNTGFSGTEIPDFLGKSQPKLTGCQKRVVGIDVSLGQVIHKANYPIKVLSQPARMYHIRDTLPQYWWQIHRWLVTIRHYFPVFPLFMIFAALPLWWAFLFLSIAIFQKTYISVGIILVGIVLVADVLSVAVINHRLVKDEKLWSFLWVALLSELFSLPILIQSLFSNKVLWRGRWLSIAET